jgi:protein disulfide-isomerase
MRLVLVLLLSGFAAFASAASPAYNENADAKAEIRDALQVAAQSRRPVLVVFGANWCGDCKILDLSFKEGASAPLIAKNFVVVKVDVGRFDRNTDVAASYGVPLKSGIPAVVVISPQGKQIYATRAGELADARSMGDKGIYEFFSKVVDQTK